MNHTDLSLWNTLTNESSFVSPYDDLGRRHVKYQYSKEYYNQNICVCFLFMHHRPGFIMMDSQMIHIQK